MCYLFQEIINFRFAANWKTLFTFPPFSIWVNVHEMLYNFDNNKVTSHLRIGRTINVLKEIENSLKMLQRKEKFDSIWRRFSFVLTGAVVKKWRLKYQIWYFGNDVTSNIKIFYILLFIKNINYDRKRNSEVSQVSNNFKEIYCPPEMYPNIQFMVIKMSNFQYGNVFH